MSNTNSGTARTSSAAFVVIASICGIVGQLIFTLDWVLAGLVEPHYNGLRQDISDFGALTAAHPLVYNIVDSLSGVLTLVAAVGLWRVLGAGRSARIGVVMLAIYGFVDSIDGLLVEDCSPSGDIVCKAAENAGTISWHHKAHNIEGLISFLTIAAAPLILAFAFKSRPQFATLRLYSLASGVISALAVIAYLAMFFAYDGSAYSGVLERVLYEVGTVWIAVVCWRMRASAMASGVMA